MVPTSQNKILIEKMKKSVFPKFTATLLLKIFFSFVRYLLGGFGGGSGGILDTLLGHLWDMFGRCVRGC